MCASFYRRLEGAVREPDHGVAGKQEKKPLEGSEQMCQYFESTTLVAVQSKFSG